MPRAMPFVARIAKRRLTQKYNPKLTWSRCRCWLMAMTSWDHTRRSYQLAKRQFYDFARLSTATFRWRPLVANQKELTTLLWANPLGILCEKPPQLAAKPWSRRKWLEMAQFTQPCWQCCCCLITYIKSRTRSMKAGKGKGIIYSE